MPFQGSARRPLLISTKFRASTSWRSCFPSFRQFLCGLSSIASVFAFVIASAAGSPPSGSLDEASQKIIEERPFEPLPQDIGKLGLQQMLRRLSTTARIMQTVAHPDDEDGGMLTLESRGEGASVLLMTLN